MKFSFLIYLIFLCCSAAWSVNTVSTPHHCEARIGKKVYRCSLGRSGVSLNKHEGDGATPVGTYPLRKVFYRPDKFKKEQLQTRLPIEALERNIGWCDEPQSSAYNQEIKLPFPQSHEKLWRADDVYDLIIVVGYNDQPVIKNKGSAIFIHIARENYPGTAGCIALEKNDLLKILSQLSPKSRVSINSSGKVTFLP